MADTTYNIKVRYDLDKSNAESGAASLAKTFDRLAMAVSGAFAVHKILDFTAKLVLLQSQNEQFQISLATMLTGFGAPGFTKGINSFKDAMGASAGLMQQIRKDAAALPGTAEDLMMIMQQAMPGAIRSGHSILGQDSAFDISKKLLLASQYIPGGAATAAREFSALMEGRAIGRNDLFARIRPAMREGAPISAKEFNALDEQKRWDMVSKALTTIYGPALAEYGNTWKSIFTTTQNWVQQLARVATGGMFNVLKTHLKDVNDWLVKNQSSVEDMLKGFGSATGEAAVSVFSSMKDALSFLVANRGSIIPVLQLAAAAVLGGKLAGGFGKQTVGGALGGFGLGLGINAITGGAAYDAQAQAMGIAGALTTFGGALGIASAAALAFGAAMNMIDADRRADIQRQTEGNRLTYAVPDLMTGALASTNYAIVKQIIKENNLAPDLYLNEGRFQNYLNTNAPDLTMQRRQQIGDAFDMVAARMRDETPWGPNEGTLEDKLKAKLYDKPPDVPKPRDVNLTINIKQDISQAEDPERLLVMTQRAIEDALIRPIESGNNRFSPLR